MLTEASRGRGPGRSTAASLELVRQRLPDEAGTRAAAAHVRATRDRLLRSLEEDQRGLRARGFAVVGSGRPSMSGKSEAVRLPAAATAADVTSDPAEDRGAAHWQRNLVVCVFGCFTTIVAMTLLLPFLPLYVEQLGVTDHAAIAEWSGAAYGATFLHRGALCAPLWGRLADLYGRKLMLIRASLGMAVAMSLIGMAQNVWQLVALRLLAGLLGGYASGSVVRWSRHRRRSAARAGRWACCRRASWRATWPAR